ncbi:sickle tail protein homolog isoform X2 [Hippocampus comes]|uniref:sickle tail protein homolog isoform X2 n=1 Tax=Hippocampus comes TaxID=109280 RepID=UPI00094E380B|nr:PREDICTED: sickle tail protein homolog isoform X2 [Hippocampus comes]
MADEDCSRAEEQTKSNLRVTSPEDAEYATRRQASPNGAPASRADAKSSGRAVPRRHTLGGARGSREILAMQPPDMDKKREAFLEHLKHKYPHHASAIMGHQERLREQSLQAMLSSLHSELDIQSYLMTIQSPGRTSRSPKHCPSPQPGVDVDHLSLNSLDSMEAMSEVDAPIGFTRGSRVRASLPVVRSTNQTKDRSLGVLYLQYGDETKQIRMPNEITSIDTVRALFVSAFPQMLTMKMLESPSVAVYVKDDMRNVYYELSDVRNITDHSCLKVYHKDPAQAFSHGPRPANDDARTHGDMVNPLRQPPGGPPPHHPLQATLPSSPHSPSRIPFSPRQGSLPGNGTVPRERLSTAPARSSSPCPSAILERRDVKPDGDMGGKGHGGSRANEGHYADPYLLQEGRMGMTTAHAQHPNTGHDGPEHGFHRVSIRSTSSYGAPSPIDSIDHPSLYRQKSRNSQLPTLGSKTPPPSPHRMTDVRLIDIHGGVPMERSSSVRQSFRKEDATGTKGRNNAAPSDVHSQGPVPAASDIQTRERMKAMEQQIASLTGLVQHALLKGPDKEPLSERPSKTSSPAHSAHSSSGSPVLAPKCNAFAAAAAPPQDKQSQIPLKANLLQFRKNVSDLRMQLQQMRQLQLQNQEIMRVQLKRAEQEIGAKLAEALRRLEDPVQKQRVLVEEDRQKYLGLEERVLTQLGDLEQYVGTLQKDLLGTHRAVTLKDVEEGAVTLRKVGESLAGLKGEFPALQTRMRAVLRVEVEAVKFLKEEPHKLDSMLKRVKSLTDTLSSLRRSASESSQRVADPSSDIPADNILFPAETPPASVSTAAPPESQSSTVKSEVKPSSPVVIHHVQSSPVPVRQSQQSASLSAAQPSPPLAACPAPFNAPSLSKSQGRESPKATSADPPSPAHHKMTLGSPVNHGNGTANQGLVIEELQHSKEKCKNRAMSIEAAEKEWEERRQNMGQYDEKEFEKILQEAEANMIKGLPSPDVESNPLLPPAASRDQAKIPLESPTEPQPEPPMDKPAKRVPEKLSKLVMEKTAKPAPERPPKTPGKPASPDSFNKMGSEIVAKSPPPPPPRKTFGNSGMTTTRSGEVVYTSRKDSQEGEEERLLPVAQIKPNKSVPPEPRKPATPPPVVAREEEDDSDRIMAELQVFQKCTIQEVGPPNTAEPAPHMEAQIRELRADKKSSEPKQDEKDPDTDENGNTTVRQSQGVIYYVTGKIPKEQPHHSGTEESHEHREPTQSPSQVSNVTINDNSPGQPQQQEQRPPKLTAPKSPPPKSAPLKSPPPISPKPAGLTAFKLPRKPLKRSESLKTSTEMEKGKNLNRIGTEKKSQLVLESVSSSKNVKSEAGATALAREGSKGCAPPPPPRRSSSEEHNPPKCNFEEANEEASLSPDLPGEEAPPPPDNIAFMITNTKVQALSCGEYKELVNAKRGSVQTVTVGGGNNATDSDLPLDNGFNKKPVIIIFDEPMDIRAAYKRLSTIFECEEELDRMLAAERIDEESEESDTDRSGGLQVKTGVPGSVDGEKVTSSQAAEDHTSLSSSSSSLILDSADTGVSNGEAKQDSKKKFKFKFPKKQFAALTQAIRTGTKSGKKTLQVVVYEDEEESDGTVKQHKEAKRFEISRSKSSAESLKAPSPTPLKRHNSDSVCRTNEIRKNTYKTLDSLEQTIKQLETTINEIGPVSPEEPVYSEVKKGENGKVSEGLRRSASLPTSKASALKLASKGSFQKKHKPLLLPRPVVIPASTSSSTTAVSAPSTPSTIQQNTSVASPTSRMPIPLSAKSRQSPATTDKAGKQPKLQDAQRQFRQANGSTKRVGADHKTTSPTVPVSKIPAFYPSATKGGSDAANPANPSSSSKSSLPSSHNARSASLPSSHIPSLSNGSLKPPSQHAAKALSFSSQTPNGRVHSSSSFSSSSSSSTSPSLLSPLGPGGKSIRTIHTPSFTSYRAHNGSSGKSCIPTASAAKD